MNSEIDLVREREQAFDKICGLRPGYTISKVDLLNILEIDEDRLKSNEIKNRVESADAVKFKVVSNKNNLVSIKLSDKEFVYIKKGFVSILKITLMQEVED